MPLYFNVEVIGLANFESAESAFSFLRSENPTTVEDNTPQDKAKVIHLTVIVDFINGPIVIEETYYKSYQRNQPVPKAPPETCRIGIESFVAGSATG
jgi:hypothetical protein